MARRHPFEAFAFGHPLSSETFSPTSKPLALKPVIFTIKPLNPKRKAPNPKTPKPMFLRAPKPALGEALQSKPLQNPRNPNSEALIPRALKP